MAAFAVLVRAFALTAGAQTTIDYTLTAVPGWWTLHAGRVTATWMDDGTLPSPTLHASERGTMRVQLLHKLIVQVRPIHVGGVRAGMARP